MTGPEYDEDEPDEFRPVPHPDDRLWRHPSEMAAMHAAQQNAETAKVPVVQVDAPAKPRLHRGLLVAAGVAIVGAGALSVGVLSSRTPTAPVELANTAPVEAPSDNRTGGAIADTEAAVDATSEGESQLAARVRSQVGNSLPRIQVATATVMREGSGLFVTDDGHIATSAGLVNGAEYVLAWTDDGRRWKATVLATDPHSDVAVLHIDSQDWPAIALASSSNLRSGQYAMALDHTDGQIAIGEVTDVEGPFLRVDQPAALPGSALIDDTGAVIAMITADGSNSSATPAWMIERVAVDLITSGRAAHAWLGGVVEEIPDASATVVRDVLAGSPAAAAGLQVGDVIDSVNGEPSASANELRRSIQQSSPGDELVLTVSRDGDRRIIIATLGERGD